MSEPDLSSLLSSLTPDDMAHLSDMAQQLFGAQGQEPPPAPEPNAPPFGGVDPEVMSKLMKILPLLQQGGDSERAQLIRALRPLLSQSRRRKADEALRLLRLIEVIPLLGQAGIELF